MQSALTWLRGRACARRVKPSALRHRRLCVGWVTGQPWRNNTHALEVWAVLSVLRRCARLRRLSLSVTKTAALILGG